MLALVPQRQMGFTWRLMLYEPTTLANVARVVGETLEQEYGVDPAPLFAEARIDTRKFTRPGARVFFSKMGVLWTRAVEVTGDRWFGLKAGQRATPSDFYVLGHAWLASATLEDAMERLVRYAHVLSTAISNVRIRHDGDTITLIESFPDPEIVPNRAADDAGFVAFFNLCEIVRRQPVRPLSVELIFPPEDASPVYDELFQCPISYGNEEEAFHFSAEEFAEPLAGHIPEVLDSSTRIAEEYLKTVEQSSVAADVRRMLIQALPSGNSDQDTIANRLYRSRSTLQRQLAAEGTSYRDILEDTRRGLAERYLRNGNYTQAEIAYMIGFADQSNFARAFRRWTGMSPGQYQKAA